MTEEIIRDNLEEIMNLAIRYIVRHHELGFFHGDIKPANIFYDQIEITTDAGSLLYIGSKKSSDDKYIITVYTPGFASSEHVAAVKQLLPRTRE